MEQVHLVPGKLAPLLLYIMEVPQKAKLALVLDRTNWKFGKADCNILYLAVVWQGIGYDLRIKENGQYISCARGGMVKAASLFQDLRPGECTSLGLRMVGKISGYKALVCGFKTNTGEIVVLIHSACVCEPWNKYRLRWQIECLFRALKTGGFDLEATHITRAERLDTLVGALAIDLCIAYRVGGLVVNIMTQ